MFNFSHKFLFCLIFLICLVLSLGFGSALQQANAQESMEHALYLPLITKGKPGDVPAPGHYTKMLASVQQTCAATGFNQVCTANGQATLQGKNGLVIADKPGTITNLADVQSISLASTGTDPQQWSVAWLRLQTDSGSSDQAINILAFGNVQISSIALFDTQAAVTDTIILPSLQFSGNPVEGVIQKGSSGLVVINPTDEELLSLTLNQVGLSLGSTALVQAQPGRQMTVAMATGAVLAEANGGTGTAIQNQQVAVPLNQAGKPVGSPKPATAVDPLEYVFGDIFRPLLTEELANSMLKRLNRSIDRCQNNESRYVYNVLFWTRVIETEPAVKARLDSAKLAQAYDRATDCLTFNVEVWSHAATLHAFVNQSSIVSPGDVPLTVQFYPEGDLLSSNTDGELKYRSYSYTPVTAACPIGTEIAPGQVMASDGTLKVAVNTIRLSLDIQVTHQPTDRALLNCPSVPPLVLARNHWVTAFYFLHEALRPASDLHTFRFAEGWRYELAGGYGGFTYTAQKVESEFTFEASTDIDVFHAPGSLN